MATTTDTAETSDTTVVARERLRSVLIVTCLAAGLVASGALAAGAWLLAAPAMGTFERPASVFASFQPIPGFPLLSRARERFFLLLVAWLPVGAVLLALATRWLFGRLGRVDGRVVAIVLLAAQVVLAVVAILALTLDPDYYGRGPLLGWGWPRVLVGAAIAAGVMTALAHHTASPAGHATPRPGTGRRVVGIGGAIGLALLLGVLLLASFELAASVKDTFNTSWVVNELLAPAADSYPLAGYATTYTNLLGYLLVPAVGLGAEPEQAAMLLIALAIAITLVATYLMLRQLLGRLAAAGGVLAAVAVAKTSQLSFDFPTPDGSLRLLYDTFSYHQIMPVRLLGPFVLAWLVVRGTTRATPWDARWLGVAAAAVTINNVDFGAAATVAALAGTLLWVPWEGRTADWARAAVRIVGHVLVGFVLGGAMLVAGVWALTRTSPDLDSTLLYVRQFGSGIIGLPLDRAFDFHVVVIGTFVVGVLAAIGRWLARPTGDPSAVAALYLSVFGLGTIAYYVNRPVISTLIGGSFYVWATALVVLAAMAFHAAPEMRRRLRIATFTLATVCATAFTQIAFPPPVSAERERLRTGRIEGADALLGEPAALAFITASSRPGATVAILLGAPKTLALRAGLNDIVPFSSMPFATYPELDLLIDRLQQHPEADVYVPVAEVAPEILDALARLGFVEVDRDAEVALYRRPAGDGP